MFKKFCAFVLTCHFCRPMVRPFRHGADGRWQFCVEHAFSKIALWHYFVHYGFGLAADGSTKDLPACSENSGQCHVKNTSNLPTDRAALFSRYTSSGKLHVDLTRIIWNDRLLLSRVYTCAYTSVGFWLRAKRISHLSCSFWKMALNSFVWLCRSERLFLSLCMCLLLTVGASDRLRIEKKKREKVFPGIR